MTQWAKFCKRIESPSVKTRLNSFQKPGICLLCGINYSQIQGGQPPSLPTPGFTFFSSFSPFLSLSFLSYFLSPTVLNIYYMPGVKYSCTHWCPKRINGTFGSAYNAVTPPFSLWHRMTLTWSIKWYLHNFYRIC